MPSGSLDRESFNPTDWFIDVPGRIAYHRDRGIGFGITFLPAELAADVIGVGGFKAVPALTHCTSRVTEAEIDTLARQAIELYVSLLRRALGIAFRPADLIRQIVEIYVAPLRQVPGRASHIQRFRRTAWHFLSHAHDPRLISVATTGPILSYRNGLGDFQ